MFVSSTTRGEPRLCEGGHPFLDRMHEVIGKAKGAASNAKCAAEQHRRRLKAASLCVMLTAHRIAKQGLGGKSTTRGMLTAEGSSSEVPLSPPREFWLEVLSFLGDNSALPLDPSIGHERKITEGLTRRSY